MSSDFIFVNPNKIPPRRAANSGASGRVKIRKTKSPIHQKNDNDEWWSSDGDVLEFDLLGESPPRIDLAFIDEPAEDLLTRVIFAGYKSNKPRFVKPRHQVDRLPDTEENFTASSPKFSEPSREKILAELESINSKDAELAKKFQRIELPRRDARANLVSPPRADLDENQEAVEIKLNVASPKKSFNSPEPDQFRAENDWFNVSLAVPERFFELKELTHKRRAFRGEETEEKAEPRGKDRFRIRTYLAVFSALIVPLSAGVFLFSGKDNFVASAFNSFNAKLLSTSSFTLVNSEESSIFPKLVEVNLYLRNKGLSQPADSITGFIEDNNTFGWINFFKKKAGGGPDSIGSFNFRLKSLELLDSAESVLASPILAEENLSRVYNDLKDYVDWLNFWDQLTSPEKHYLIVVADADKSWPGGGRLESYALVKTETDGLETLSSGRFNALDAALDLKIIPPEPVKSVSTAWLPSQALWFLDFKESAKTLVNFFENTTQKKVDGVMVIDKNFLKKLSFKESLLYDADSANWFYGLSEALARKPNTRWVGLAEYLERGLAAHQVQFYFKDSVLEKFAEDSGWLLLTRRDSEDDLLGISWASLDGNSPGLELVEYKINVFEDGSVMANLNLMLKQSASAPGRSYFKIYLPQDSQVLKAEGFSSKEKPPEFYYSSGGFSSDARIARAAAMTTGPGSSDIFYESGLTVVGGWVQLKNNARNSLSLEYLLPFKLSRRAALADYGLKVFRPHQNQDVPFRFVVVPQKEIQLTSLEPDGFVTQNLGEYQGVLAQDLDLTAAFIFSE